MLKMIKDSGKLKIILIILVLLLLVLLTRLSFLSLRPLHHDEGVNYFFSSNILQSGNYTYDPTNYHGPLYFFALFTSFLFFGVSEFTLRLPAALFGVGIIILPLIFLKKSPINPFIASLFLIFSPSLIYYSRYSIHESALAFFSALIIFLLARFIENKEVHLIPYFALSLVFLFATKETAVIFIPSVILIILIYYKEFFLFPWKKYNYVVLFSASIALLFYIALYTGFFIHLKGLIDSFFGLSPWMTRGFEGAGHLKPWHYYLKIIFQFETPLLLLVFLGLAYFKKNVYVVSTSLWFIVSFTIYSTLGYKAPWLIINITVPLALLAAYGFSKIDNGLLKVAFLSVTLLYLSYFSFIFNFITTWQDENPYAYVHTNADILGLIQSVEKYAQKNSKVLVAASEYWPLPFYLRDYRVEYLSDITSLKLADYTGYGAFIIQDKIFNASEIPDDVVSKSYTLRGDIDLYLIFREKK